MTDDVLKPWPFEDDPNTASFTTSHVVIDLKPVIHVVRDLDGDWQFLGREGADESQVKIVALKTIVSRHPDILAIADLPVGWEAWRSSKEDAWSRRRIVGR